MNTGLRRDMAAIIASSFTYNSSFLDVFCLTEVKFDEALEAFHFQEIGLLAYSGAAHLEKGLRPQFIMRNHRLETSG